AYQLRSQPHGCMASARALHRPRPQGREACGPAGRAVEQVRACHQRLDRQDARPYRARQTARRRRRGDRVKRREFIRLLGGAAATWPLAARAQQAAQTRRVGVLMMSSQDGPDQPSVMRIEQLLTDLGWIEGRNIRIEVRWSEGNLEKARAYAKA